jgi:hypothetical protein
MMVGNASESDVDSFFKNSGWKSRGKKFSAHHSPKKNALLGFCSRTITGPTKTALFRHSAS